MYRREFLLLIQKRQKTQQELKLGHPHLLPQPLWVQKPQPGILPTFQVPHKNLNNCKHGQIPGLCQCQP